MSKYFDSKSRTFMEPEVVEHGRHMVMTNVHKDTKVQYVNIDTRFQEEYHKEKYASVQCKLPQAVTNVKSIKVVSGEIPFSFYNFSTQRQNAFFTIQKNSDAPILIHIDDGHYADMTSLAAEIDSKFISLTNTASSTTGDLVLTVNTATYKVNIRNSSSNTYTIRFNVDKNGAEDKYSLKTKLGWALGYREPMYTLASGDSIDSETFLNIHPFRYLNLSIDEFSSSKSNSFLTPSFQSYMDSNVLARISLDPNAYQFGSIISVNLNGGKLFSDVRSYNGKTDIQRLHIQLLDEEGRQVDLNRMDFSFLLEIEYI